MYEIKKKTYFCSKNEFFFITNKKWYRRWLLYIPVWNVLTEKKKCSIGTYLTNVCGMCVRFQFNIFLLSIKQKKDSSWKQRRVQQTSITESSDWDASSRQVVAGSIRISHIELLPQARYRVPTFYLNCRNFIPCSWNFSYHQFINMWTVNDFCVKILSFKKKCCV